MMRPMLLLTVLCLLVVAGTRVISAQEASPVAVVTCDVEPRTVDELLGLWYADDGSQISAAASPEADSADSGTIAIPIGEPADDATAAAISAVAHEVFACFDTGDPLKAYALFTDDLATVFGPEPGTPIEDAEAFLTSPDVEEESGVSEIIAVTNVMQLADGRVGAFAVDRTDGVDTLAYVIFAQDGERWLIDEVIEFPSSLDE
jgi:hypothetical protein